MQRLFFLLTVLCLLFLVSCAAFQTQPALKNFNGLDLYQFIDAKADSSQAKLVRLISIYNRVARDLKNNQDAFNAINNFLNKEAEDGKLDISTIEELNRRGFNITVPQLDDLPSSLPDTTGTNSNDLWE